MNETNTAKVNVNIQGGPKNKPQPNDQKLY